MSKPKYFIGQPVVIDSVGGQYQAVIFSAREKNETWEYVIEFADTSTFESSLGKTLVKEDEVAYYCVNGEWKPVNKKPTVHVV